MRHAAAKALGAISVLSLLLSAKPAAALGAFVVQPPASARVTEVRTAIAASGGQRTTWSQLRAKGTAKAFAWVLPLHDDTVVDASTSAFFDALEDATATRIRPPGTPPTGATCALSKSPETVTVGDAEPYLFPELVNLAPTIADVAKTLDDWGFEDKAVSAPTSTEGVTGYLVLRFSPPPSSFATLTVRITETAPPAVEQTMLEALPTLRLETTTYLIGAERGRLPSATLLEIAASSVSWRDASRTTYREVRDSLLATTRAGFVVESADTSAISTTKAVAEATVPSLVDAYLSRVRDRGEATFDFEETRADILADQAAGAVTATPCPRGDLAGKAVCQREDSPRHLDDDSDDLAFALSGAKVITRLAGAIAPNERGVAASVAFVDAAMQAEAPVIRTPTPVWSLVCSNLPSTGGGSSNGTGGAGSGKGAGKGTGTGRSGEADGDTENAVGTEPTSNVTVLCDGSSRDAAGDGACSSGSDASNDSCSSDSGDGSNDSCGSSDGEADSCSNSDGSDSCSGSDGSGADGCSNADGSAPSCDGASAGGDSCGNCAVTGGKPSKRIRISPITLGLACVASLLRRRTRPRRHGAATR